MNPLVLKLIGGLVGAVALIFALLALFKSVDSRAYDRGVSDTSKVWQDRELKQAAAYDTKYKALNDQYRDREKQWSTMLSNVDTAYQKELNDAAKQTQADVAAARSGAMRLRVHVTECAPAIETSGSPPSGTAASTGSGHGAAGAELSGAAIGTLSAGDSEFLVSEANRADGIVRQLSACQAVVRADRTISPQ